jgi:hypothetical protein
MVTLEEINETVDVHRTYSLRVPPMELAPAPLTEERPAREAHLRSEDPNPQRGIIPLMRVPNWKVLRVPILVLGDSVRHASLKPRDQTIEPEGRPFQNVVLCVALAEEFFGGDKLVPVLEGLRGESRPFSSTLGRSGSHSSGNGCSSGTKELKVWPYSCQISIIRVRWAFRSCSSFIGQLSIRSSPPVYHTPDPPTRFVRKGI